ncbi:LysR family transcriptional regulator [Paenibacillus solisilvae]|uniref:LysR family transcriptional regulator n=1 Tax=Paenibacillus solisilvae TaxID=2486751 RepID=A0ABW0W0T2_9BACL
MNIDNIEAFVYIFHLGSFKKAADALFLTQPSVTARIQTIEREMNAKLFFREGKQITLTEKGKLFLPYAENILQSYQEAKHNMLNQPKRKSELNIACSLSVSTYIIPEILTAFRAKFPDVMIKISTGHSNDVLEKVINKQVDFGIARSVSHSNIESSPFFTDPIHLVVPPGHPFAVNPSSVTIEEVSREPLIFFDHGSIDWMMIHGLFESKKLSPNVVLEVDSMEAAKQMVIKGIGISFLPEMCVRTELEEAQLCQITISTSVELERKIECLFLKQSKRPPFLSFFTHFIQSQSNRLNKN